MNKGFFATLDWAYYSEKQFFLYESAEFQDDSLEIGLRARLRLERGQVRDRPLQPQLLDDEIVRGGIDFNNLTGFTNDPATWGLEFAVNFH